MANIDNNTAKPGYAPRVEMWTLDRLHPYANNPRRNDDAVPALVESIATFGFKVPIVARPDGEILAGHTRFKAALRLGMKEVPVLVADDLDDMKAKAFRLADNKVAEAAEWDLGKLEEELADLQGADFDMEAFGFDEGAEAEEDEERKPGALAERFVVPPFTVLNSQHGYWMERKKAWRAKIGDNGESREAKLFGAGLCSEINNSVSILDPVLAETIISWFGYRGGKAFDTFAGDTVFGFVAASCGMNFAGIELRQDQTDLNNARTKDLPASYICDDGQNVARHFEPESQDLFFSCPPYFDLEVYSDKPNDASNQATYQDFLAILRNAFHGAVQCLKPNRFAVVVCGDIRDKKGLYRRFPDDIKTIFADAGMPLYNELVLVEPLGTLPSRVGNSMKTRKVGKCHQNILVFYKGDISKIKETFPEITYESRDLEPQNLD